MKFSTSVRVISAWCLAFGLMASAQAQSDPALKDSRPDRYVVQKGDTLWSIASRFLKEPWRWPDLWRMNKDQIRNPHRIYPGDVIVLDSSGSSPQLRVAQSAASARETIKLSPTARPQALASTEIPSIPAQDIEPFLTKSQIVSEEFFANAARIVKVREPRMVNAERDIVFAWGIDREKAQSWHVYRRGEPLRSLDGEVLGIEAVFLGSAQVEKHAPVSRMVITEANQEIVEGDLLIPAPSATFVNYVPHAPDKDLAGNIIALPRGVHAAGQLQTVTIDLGRTSSLEVGHVLAVYRKGGTMIDPKFEATTPMWKRWVNRLYWPPRPEPTVEIPDDRIGLVFVFRTFDKVAYAMIVENELPIEVGDYLRKP